MYCTEKDKIRSHFVSIPTDKVRLSIKSVIQVFIAKRIMKHLMISNFTKFNDLNIKTQQLRFLKFKYKSNEIHINIL